MSPSHVCSRESLKSAPRIVSIVEIISSKVLTNATNIASFDLMTFFVAICPYFSKIFLYNTAYSFGILKLSTNSNSSSLPRTETLVDLTKGADMSLAEEVDANLESTVQRRMQRMSTLQLQQVPQQTQNLQGIHPTQL
ncbi:hypothetical protein MKX03_022276 [Papaver bracteatum]|nr:hypothetical protein MKX03_022276 [Papaver bracteatum]